jgi:hypothetical protein
LTTAFFLLVQINFLEGGPIDAALALILVCSYTTWQVTRREKETLEEVNKKFPAIK